MSAASPSPQRGRWLWVAVALFTLATLLLIVFLAARLGAGAAALPGAKGPAAPGHHFTAVLTYQRDGQAFRPSDPALAPTLPPEKEAQLKLAVELRSALTQTSSSASATHNARASVRDLALFLDSDTAETHELALQVVTALEKSPSLQEITVYPPGQTPAEGAPQPAVFLRLWLERGAGSEIQVFATGGNSYLVGFNPPGGHLPPGLYWDFDFESTLDHHAKGTGVGDPTAKQLAGAALALAEKLMEIQADQLAEYPPMPELPAYFHPAPTPTPDLPLLRRLSATRLVTLRGLLTSNITYWIFTAPEAPEVLLPALSAELQAAGWAEDRILAENDGIRLLNLSKEGGREYLNFGSKYQDTEEYLTRISPAKPAAGGAHLYYLAYRRELTSQEQRALMLRLKAEDPTPAQTALLLDLLSYSWSKDEGWQELMLAKLPGMSVQDQLRSLQSFGRSAPPTDETRALVGEILLRCAFQAVLSDSEEDLREALVEIAERFGVESAMENVAYLPVKLTSEQRAAFGYVPVGALTPVTRALGEPLVIEVSPTQVVIIQVREEPVAPVPQLVLVRRTFSVEKEGKIHSSGTRRDGVDPGDSEEVIFGEFPQIPTLRVEIAADGQGYTVTPVPTP